jgi:hypothetical protein
MDLSGHYLSVEILNLIMVELSTSPPEKSSDPATLTSIYNDLRAIRLTCKTLACVGARYLFKNIPYSMDPADWERITAISKNPLLAVCVQRVVYRTWIYMEPYDSVQQYSSRLFSGRKSFGKNKGELELGNGLLTEESVKRGFARYNRRCEDQKEVLRTSVDMDCPEVKILVDACQSFPNLKHLSIANPYFHVSQIEAWRRAEGDLDQMEREDPAKWILRHSGRKDEESADILPSYSATPHYFIKRRRETLDGYDNAEWLAELPLDNAGVSFDQFARAKYRGLQIFDLASQQAQIRARSLSITLHEGVRLAFDASAPEPSRLTFAPFPAIKSILSGITIFNFDMECNINEDAEFLQSGSLGEALENAVCLQELRFRIRYGIYSRFPSLIFPNNNIPSTPNCGWKIPLNSVFGRSTFKHLQLLEIDGIFSTKEDLLALLTRHRLTLNTLLIASLGHFDNLYDVDYNSRRTRRWSHCSDIMKEMALLELPLENLIATPSHNRGDRLENSFSRDNKYGVDIHGWHVPFHIRGVQEIKHFLLDSHEMDPDEYPW